MSRNVTVLNTLMLVVCGIILGGTIAAAYYVPAWNDMRDQRDWYRTDSRKTATAYDELQSQVEPLNMKLKRKTADYDGLRVEYNDLSNKYRVISNNYGDLSADYEYLSTNHDDLSANYNNMKSSHNLLNDEYSSLMGEYNDQVTELNRAEVLSSQQQQQLDQVSGLMRDSYNRGYNDASSGSSDGISDLIGILGLFMGLPI